jgi:hypothetical protein
MNKLVVVMILMSFAFAKAQDKVKGNREVTTRIIDVDEFTAINLGEDFEIAIAEGTSPQVEIETDSNLHQYIDVDVNAEVMTIKTTANIRRSRRMKIRVIYTAGFNKITAFDDAEISTITDLRLSDLEVMVKDDAKVFLTGRADNLVFNGTADGKSECNLSGDQAQVNLTGSTDMEALLMYQDINITMTDRARAQLEGDADESTMVLEGRSNLTAKNLTIKDLKLNIIKNAEASINAKDNLDFRAGGDAKVELYNNPKIAMSEFSGSAMLMKK